MTARKAGVTQLSAVPTPSRPDDGIDALPDPGKIRAVRVKELDWSIYMARAQSGDKDAYRRLLDDVAPYLRSLAARRFYRNEDVEDTVQEVLLTIHSVRHTYDPSRPFGPWLVAIANRRIIDSMRRLGRSRSREEPLDEEHDTLRAPETAHHDRLSDGRVLMQAVDQLPPAQREAVMMLRMREMSLKEASAASGSSVTALKVSMHRALQKLRKIMESESP